MKHGVPGAAVHLTIHSMNCVASKQEGWAAWSAGHRPSISLAELKNGGDSMEVNEASNLNALIQALRWLNDHESSVLPEVPVEMLIECAKSHQKRAGNVLEQMVEEGSHLAFLVSKVP